MIQNCYQISFRPCQAHHGEEENLWVGSGIWFYNIQDLRGLYLTLAVICSISILAAIITNTVINVLHFAVSFVASVWTTTASPISSIIVAITAVAIVLAVRRMITTTCWRTSGATTWRTRTTTRRAITSWSTLSTLSTFSTFRTVSTRLKAP